MKTFKEFFEESTGLEDIKRPSRRKEISYRTEAYAYATGMWNDFERGELVYEGEIIYKNVPMSVKIYKGTRLGRELFETQIKWKGTWTALQYSTSLEEAMNPEERITPFDLPRAVKHENV